MTDPRAEFEQRLAVLRREYIAHLQVRLDAIEAVRARLNRSPWEPEVADELSRLLHGLAGSGATFGFESISENARAWMQQLRTVSAQGLPPDHASSIAMLEVAQRLREAILAARAAE